MSRFYNRGFIAAGAILISAFTVFGFAGAVLGTSMTYLDMILRKELRIQANLNAVSCGLWIKEIYNKDYFLTGDINVADLGCKANIVNNLHGSVIVQLQTSLGGVKADKIIDYVYN